MTRIEKEVTIRALSNYCLSQRKLEKRYKKQGETKRAMEAIQESMIANGLVSGFCSILDEPCGSVKI